MASIECQNCDQRNQVINEQKSKINLIEKRMNGLVTAYKKVCLERDNLLAITSSPVLPLNDSHEQQKRITSLEARVAEMSTICGEYESQRYKDKELIRELTQNYEQMLKDLAEYKTSQQKTVTDVKSEKILKSRGVQTEESIEWMNDETNDRTEDIAIEPQIIGRDVETQTDSVSDCDLFNVNNRKKCELAVVLPTVSETLPQQQSDDEQSVESPTSSHHSNDFPVFESNEREVQQNNDKTYSAPNASGVSLFYANELARKEIDLAETRLQAREYECALRELKWKYNTEKYRLQSRINELEKNFSQINCFQPMNDLNVTYIKNVLIKLLNTKDKQQKQFMINAILTALESTDRKPK